ncbi:aminotransferase class I/II-fold pyridoxal phosphate-dependent enzyme [Lysinibacillus sp. NPDC048646]|uniref:aminotransferase class I/II-fold pyridoxal phosphate-dependent enzyme n=1 Tax=Lysinibacillus sp. NPDC048646 TaxID=3390574 RepID=UPI003CFEF5C0
MLENVSEFRKLVNELDWVEPEGGIVAFPFLKDKTLSSQHFAEKLIASTEVSVLPGEVFERPGHFRVGFGLHPDKFRGAMKWMSEFIASKG